MNRAGGSKAPERYYVLVIGADPRQDAGHAQRPEARRPSGLTHTGLERVACRHRLLKKTGLRVVSE